MKGLILSMAVLMLVSCGENELGGKLNKESSKFITTANDIKNEIFRNSGDFTSKVGSLIEGLGQVPREFINAALGIDADTDEDLKDAEKDIADNQNQLDDLQEQIDALNEDMRDQFNDVNYELDELRKLIADSSEKNNKEVIELRKIVEKYHTELLIRINKNTRRDITNLRYILKHISLLRSTIIIISKRLSVLEERMDNVKNGKDGIDGIDGKDGKDGKDGIDGKDGKRCKEGYSLENGKCKKQKKDKDCKEGYSLKDGKCKKEKKNDD